MKDLLVHIELIEGPGCAGGLLTAECERLLELMGREHHGRPPL